MLGRGQGWGLGSLGLSPTLQQRADLPLLSAHQESTAPLYLSTPSLSTPAKKDRQS